MLENGLINNRFSPLRSREQVCPEMALQCQMQLHKKLSNPNHVHFYLPKNAIVTKHTWNFEQAEMYISVHVRK